MQFANLSFITRTPRTSPNPLTRCEMTQSTI